MATFLELCQDVSRESGTIPGSQPVAISGLTGRLEKVAKWVNTAWRQIQNSRSHWFWMQAEFSEQTLQGQARYTAAAWNLDRHAEWIVTGNTVTLYPLADGVAQEAPITFMPYRDWRAVYDRGVVDENQPINFTVSPAGELCLGPTPDAVYVVNGLYRKTPQTLVAGTDVPELPLRFHDLIAWKALIYLAEHDEAQIAMATASRRERELMADLMRDQLPEFRTYGGVEPIA